MGLNSGPSLFGPSIGFPLAAALLPSVGQINPRWRRRRRWSTSASTAILGTFSPISLSSENGGLVSFFVVAVLIGASIWRSDRFRFFFPFPNLPVVASVCLSMHTAYGSYCRNTYGFCTTESEVIRTLISHHSLVETLCGVVRFKFGDV